MDFIAERFRTLPNIRKSSDAFRSTLRTPVRFNCDILVYLRIGYSPGGGTRSHSCPSIFFFWMVVDAMPVLCTHLAGYPAKVKERAFNF